jgi:hypothetical protein
VPLGDLTARVEARIDAHDVVMVHQGDSYHGELRVAFGIFTPGVQPVLSPVMPLDVNLSSQGRNKALDQGIAVTKTLKLNEDTRAIRLVVVDRSSRSVGSVTVPVPEQALRNPQ